MNTYKLYAKMLKRKYEDIAAEFEQYRDDRILVVNMMNQLLEACKVMEGIDNPFICVAFYEAYNEQEEQMERIVTRFTGKVYKYDKWEEEAK